jgi:hypothetical protein
MLTSDATDPRVGTAEFKATAIRIETGVGSRESGVDRKDQSSSVSRFPVPDSRQ